jgi:aminopeptidase N
MDRGSEKIRTVLGLIMVILLVFITNRLDQKHFEEVQEKLSSIYYDRVVAQDYLFDLSNAFHDRKMRMANLEILNFNNDQEIDALIAKYEETTLTKKEKELFGRLKENIDDLKAQGMIKRETANANIERIEVLLADLSDIQLKESKSLKIQAQDSLDSSNLMSNLEMALIIIFGIVLQFVLFQGGKKKKTKWSTKD